MMCVFVCVRCECSLFLFCGVIDVLVSSTEGNSAGPALIGG
jgi:hypothetical protein